MDSGNGKREESMGLISVKPVALQFSFFFFFFPTLVMCYNAANHSGSRALSPMKITLQSDKEMKARLATPAYVWQPR